MDDIDTSAFERLHGERPGRLLDRHQDGRHVAMQVIAVLHTTVERAAVWDLQTGKIKWEPNDVNALAWLPGGSQLALVHEQYERAPDHPTIIGSPLQSEHSYTLVRLTWPELARLDDCRLSFPTGWPVDLVLSPRGDLALVQWQDQGESGLEFVELRSKGPEQLKETGLPQIATLMGGRIPNGGGFPLATPFAFRPVFSPDGRFIIIAWQKRWVWWNDKQGAETPSAGGDYTVGTISVLDWDTRVHRAIPLTEHLPVGWLPEPRDDGGEGLLADDPVFLDARRFSIRSPTGISYSFNVEDMPPTDTEHTSMQ